MVSSRPGLNRAELLGRGVRPDRRRTCVQRANLELRHLLFDFPQDGGESALLLFSQLDTPRMYSIPKCRGLRKGLPIFGPAEKWAGEQLHAEAQSVRDGLAARIQVQPMRQEPVAIINGSGAAARNLRANG